MGDPGHLDHVIRAVRRVDGVLDAKRDTGSQA
jgi:GTP pyrophosphokinase